MPRSLTFALDQIAKGETNERRPAYQVLIYDLRTTGDTVRDVVVNEILDPDTGPWDITQYVESVAFKEQSGAYFSGGIAATDVVLLVVDPLGRFDPLLVNDDPAIEGRFFRSGNLIRIIEGDAQVDPAFWPITFTGKVFGQVGYDRNRTTMRSELNVRATGRQADFINYSRTSNEFRIGTSYLSMATEIATNDMGLDSAEVDFPSFGTALVPHKSIQLVDESPMMMLSRIGLLDALLPYFTGDGKLSMIADRATGAPGRIYTGRKHIISIVRPTADVKPANSVCIVGLDAQLSKNTMPRQPLASLEITTGFFTPPEKIPVYWRDDRTLFAENVRLRIQVSVNGGISALGGGEEMFPILSSDPEQLGQVGAMLEADTGYAPWLVVFLMIFYIVAAAIPDQVNAFGTGVTIPYGRIIQAAALASALLVMTKLGRGSYVFEGDPFEYVYREIRACAKVAGVGEFDGLNELTLENHLVSTNVQAKQIAFHQLFRAQAETAPRTILMIHDLGMEPGDILEFSDTGERYLAVSISRTLQRDPTRATAVVEAFDISSLVSVGT